MKAPMFDELEQMTDEELVIAYNATARRVQVGLSWLRDELWRREAARRQETALQVGRDSREATHTMRRLTWVISGLTAVNVALVAVQLFGVGAG